MARREAYRGTAIVAIGGVLLLLSLLFDWVEPLPREDETKLAAVVLVPAGLATLALAVVARARGAAWPFVYTRVLGACALAAIAWAVFEDARPVKAGVLFAAIGGAMIVSGSAAALSREGETTVRRPPRH